MEAKRPLIWAVAELHGGEIAPVTGEILACAAEISRLAGGTVRAVVLGREVFPAAEALAEQYSVDVTAVENQYLADYNGGLFKEILADLAGRSSPDIICLGHTSRGLDFGPGLAVRLGASCLTGVEKAAYQDGGLVFTRPWFHGKLAADFRPLNHLAVLTVQSGCFKPDGLDLGGGRVESEVSKVVPDRIRAGSVIKARNSASELTRAEVVVAAGRGLGKKENLAQVQRLAAMFPRSAVAGSRPVCDMGWLGYASQVGQTGSTVAPRLYLACGISGARQHTAGMQSAEFIVAVSTDPNAAIFNVADVAVVEDVNSFLPVLIEELEKGRGL